MTSELWCNILDARDPVAVHQTKCKHVLSQHAIQQVSESYRVLLYIMTTPITIPCWGHSLTNIPVGSTADQPLDHSQLLCPLPIARGMSSARCDIHTYTAVLIVSIPFVSTPMLEPCSVLDHFIILLSSSIITSHCCRKPFHHQLKYCSALS